MKKIAIIGVGDVGSHVAAIGIHKDLDAEFILVDINEKLLRAQYLDISDMLPLCNKSCVSTRDFSDDFSDIDIFAITAGVAQKPDQSRFDLVEVNKKILKSIQSNIGDIKKSALVIVVSNPVDVLTHLANDIFGLPAGQVFGTGTLLDTQRLLSKLGEKECTNHDGTPVYVLGEHGDSSFVAWSRYEHSADYSNERKKEIESGVREKAYEIIDGKGSTYFGIASVVCDLFNVLLKERSEYIPLSVPLSGEYGLTGLAISVPVKFSSKGFFFDLEKNKLTDEELGKLHASAEAIRKYM